MGSSTGVRHERQEVSSTVSPRVEGSTPVRGNFFADFFSLIQYNSGRSDRMIYLRKTSNMASFSANHLRNSERYVLASSGQSCGERCKPHHVICVK